MIPARQTCNSDSYRHWNKMTSWVTLAPPLGIGCERTDYPRHVAQWALAHEAQGGVVNVHFDWRPKNNVSNYAGAEGTANERQEL
jgi:hypothetical protein